MQERIQRLLLELGKLRKELKDEPSLPDSPRRLSPRRAGWRVRDDNRRLDQKLTLISGKEAELDAAKAEFERKTGRPWE